MSAYGTLVDADGKTQTKYNLGGPSASPFPPDGALPDAGKPARVLEGRKATWAASNTTMKDSLRVSTARSTLEPHAMRQLRDAPPGAPVKLVQGYVWARHPAKETLQETMAPPEEEVLDTSA